MYLIVDTETSNFYNASLGLDHPQQGRVIQLAALLLDESLGEIACLSTLIHQPTAVISPGAESVHGISKEMCERYGISMDTGLRLLSGFLDNADAIVAHNYSFDSRMLQNEGLQFMNKPSYCTMQLTTELCKLPHAKRPNSYKWPKLTEALKLLLNEELNDAHDALADARGCAKLFRYLVKNNYIELDAKQLIQ